MILTALFAVTAGWALVRLARTATGRGPATDVVAELVHLLMSVAMIAMARGVVTGPDDAGGIATLAVFGVVLVWATVRLGRGTARHRAAIAFHVLTSAAMLWMVAAMPAIMGRTDEAPATEAHGMAGMPGMAPTAPTAHDAGPSTGITALTWLLALTLVAAASLWVLRAVRTSTAPTAVPAPTTAPNAPPATPARGGVAVLTSLASVATPTPVTSAATARLDAGCHALMGLGMAGMIVAML